MLNTTLKKDAIRKLKNEVDSHEQAGKETTTSAIKLHETRNNSVVVIDSIEQYVNSLANTPKEFDKELEEIKVNLSSFKVLSEIEYDEKTMLKIAGGGTAAGVAAGVATAAFAPAAAMAIATTFGTASTGAAISGLSGVAATNAALAWLGGGALAAGGGGMAGGGALLALAGPIGWTIGAATLITGGIFASKKNKDAAIRADAERIKISVEKKKLQAINHEITELDGATKRLANELYMMFHQFTRGAQDVTSYTSFTSDQKNKLIAIINNAHSLSALFMKEIG
ncbi:hypothetical protein [Exiguobacterium sp. ZWU0009]|uniref:hypothetical protein n=1 Tax=Exiguobacterium sp. ZWU0009 TaxID=1224749 RepID=UPI000647666A|nr:hypothetical protein [Exiguobacterium sp. ZWU0009]